MPLDFVPSVVEHSHRQMALFSWSAQPLMEDRRLDWSPWAVDVTWGPTIALVGSELVTAARNTDLRPAYEKASKLVRLPKDWDGYGAAPIDAYYVRRALDLLSQLVREDTPLPDIVPTTRGGVQLEWHERGIDLEISIESLSVLHVSFEDAASGKSWDANLTTSLAKLDEAVVELSGRR